MDQPLVILFAGPNGSGKSTITAAYRQLPWFPGRYLNADELACVRTEAVQEDRERAAFRQARQLRQTYCEDGVSFAFETVFSHPSTLLDMQRFRAAGFVIHLVYVTTSNSAINAGRVTRRVLTGGHDVPPDKIHARYQRSLRLMPRAAEEADLLDVFDNSGREPILCLIRSQDGEAYVNPAIPEYMYAALLQPLQERQVEREALASRFPSLLLPDEAVGTYTGQLTTAGTHYLTQQCQGIEGAIRHDRLMLTTNHELAEGQSITISYKDGMGFVEFSG